MNISVRQILPNELDSVKQLVENSFAGEPFCDGTESDFVEQIQQTEHYIPQLSLVAECKFGLCGYILLTKNKIVNSFSECSTLILHPLCVLPAFQYRGIGKKLVEEAVQVAGKLGFSSIFTCGNPGYFSKFGFQPAMLWEVHARCRIANDFLMAKELVHGALNGVQGYIPVESCRIVETTIYPQ